MMNIKLEQNIEVYFLLTYNQDIYQALLPVKDEKDKKQCGKFTSFLGHKS